MYNLGVFQTIAVDDIAHSPNILRNPQESVDELAVSIMQKGLIHPIVVRPIEDNRYELIAGHRRFEACKRLGLQKIMCHILDVNDKEAYEIAITENVQQKTMSPIEEALAFKRYVETFGWGGVSNLARKIGKSQEYISKRIKLLSLPESLQQDIVQGKINVSTAQELFPLSNTEVAENLGDYILENNLSAKEARRVVKVFKESGGDLGASFDQSNSDLEFLLPRRINEENEDDSSSNVSQSELLFRVANPMLKKCALGIRISLKNIDDILGEMEDDRSSSMSESHWITKELLMQHRIRLHEQLDQLLRQRSKLKHLQRLLFLQD